MSRVDGMVEQLRSLQRSLLRQRRRHAAGVAVSIAFLQLPKIALGLCLGYFGIAAVQGEPFPAWVLPILLPLFPLAHALRARSQTPPPNAWQTAIAKDRAHHTKDRISAAIELGSEPEPGRFAQAAVADGEECLQRLGGTDAQATESLATMPRSWWMAGFAVAVACIPVFLQLFAPQRPDVEPTPGRQISQVQPQEKQPTTERQDRTTTPRQPTTGQRRRSQPTTPLPSQAQNTPPGNNKATIKPGQASDAAPSGRARTGSAARPQPNSAKSKSSQSPGAGGPAESSQAEGADNDKQTKTNKPRPAAAPTQRRQTSKRRTPDNGSASTGGSSPARGKSLGVGNKPRSNDRSNDMQAGEEPEDDEIEEEQEVQEQRGGVMPMRKDRRNAPARELQISGDGPPGDGRGGPSPKKKSRGTASLVMGLRLPDQVRGQPNPGTAKTSLHPTTPQRGGSQEAAARPRRNQKQPSPQSREPRPGQPFWRAVVQRYHQLLRGTSTKK